MPPTSIQAAAPPVTRTRPTVRGPLGADLEARYVKNLIGLKECAALTGLTPRTISYYAVQSRIPSVKIVHARVFDRAAIVQWMENRPVNTPAARELKFAAAASLTAAQPRIESPLKGMTVEEAQKLQRGQHGYGHHPGYCAPGDDCPLCGERERRDGFIHYCGLGDGSSHSRSNAR